MTEPDATVRAGVDLLHRHLEAGDLTCVLCDHGAALATPPRWNVRFGALGFVGPARTVLAPAGELAAVRAGVAGLEPGAVLVVAAAGAEAAVWGENLALAARARGAAGVVIAGLVRDVVALEQIGLPIAAWGVAPNRSEAPGEGASGKPVRLGAVPVRNGDVVVSDPNGIVVIPREELPEAHERLESWIAAERRSPQEETG